MTTSEATKAAKGGAIAAPAPLLRKLFYIGPMPMDSEGNVGEEHTCGRTSPGITFRYANEEDEYPSAKVRQELGDELIAVDRYPLGNPHYRWA